MHSDRELIIPKSIKINTWNMSATKLARIKDWSETPGKGHFITII